MENMSCLSHFSQAVMENMSYSEDLVIFKCFFMGVCLITCHGRETGKRLNKQLYMLEGTV